MIWGILAGFLSGIIGAMGLGGGGVLLIYLSAFLGVEQLKAQGINLLFFIPIGIVAVIIYAIKGEIKWKKIIPFALFGLIGAVIGFFLSKFLGAKITAKIFGGLLVFLGIKQIFKKS